MADTFVQCVINVALPIVCGKREYVAIWCRVAMQEIRDTNCVLGRALYDTIHTRCKWIICDNPAVPFTGSRVRYFIQLLGNTVTSLDPRNLHTFKTTFEYLGNDYNWLYVRSTAPRCAKS